MALAWHDLPGGECQGCAGDLAETTDPVNQGRWIGEAIVCFKCEARDRARDIANEADRDMKTRTYGVSWFATEKQ